MVWNDFFEVRALHPAFLTIRGGDVGPGAASCFYFDEGRGGELWVFFVSFWVGGGSVRFGVKGGC